MSELRELGDISLPFALDEKKNYIYIKDAYRDRDYYCPCCGKKVNTIAIDEDKEYQMPPHYRHYPHQSCSGESLAHWVYKMWLFDKDSRFYVYNGSNKSEHIVKSIDIEKTYHTDYGDYRPDITITTSCDKIFFFELNFSNPKRSDDYFCKWSQLNYDVIEVDVKKLLKESLNNKIPTFRLIYSDGICLDDKYNRRDVFANAANKLLARKLEIQRQDMLNCKIVLEKLDWFFDSIKSFKAMKSTMDDVLNSFSNVPYEEMELCFDIIKRITCINNNQAFRDIINVKFFNELKKLEDDYNYRYKHIAYFKIENNLAHRFNFYIEIKTNLKIGILETTRYQFKQKFIWKKHHYPFSFYKNFSDVFFEFSDGLAKHMYNTNEINMFIRNTFNQNEISYIKNHTLKNAEFASEFITSEKRFNKIIQFFKDNIDSIGKKAIAVIIKDSCGCINEYFIENNLPYKLNYKYNEIQKSIMLVYCEFWDRNEINLLDLDGYPMLKDKTKDELVEEIKTIFNLHYKNVLKNKISNKVLDVIYELRTLVSGNKNHWVFKSNHIDINHIKIQMGIRVYHKGCGYVYYYSDDVIDIKDNKIDNIYLSQLSKEKLDKLLKDKLSVQMKQSLLKLNKIDGINCSSRFMIKEDK